MNRCTSMTRRWPDDPVDVHPDEEEEFLAHAEDCAYHAVALRAEGKEFLNSLRKHYRLARIFGGGRILEGEELVSAAASRRAQTERWDEAATRRELPFSHIALYNNGVEIARYSRLFTINKYDGVHELEPDAGIEIWGVVASNGLKVEAWLASYDFAAAPPGKEKVIDLKNGYTVALKVGPKGDADKFRIEFRFIETEEPKNEKLREGVTRARGVAAGGDAAGGQRRFSKRAPAERAPRRREPLRPMSLVRCPAAQMTLSLLLIAALGVRAGEQSKQDSFNAMRQHARPAEQRNNARADKQQTATTKPPNKGGSGKKPKDAKASHPPLPQKPDAPRPGAMGGAPQAVPEEHHEVADLLRDSATTEERMRGSEGRGASSDSSIVFSRPRVVKDLNRPKPGQGLLASLGKNTSAGEGFIFFNVGRNKELLERLDKMIRASGRDVQPITRDQKSSRAQQLLTVELIVVPQSADLSSETGVQLIFRTEIGGKTETLSQKSGVGVTMADASTNALKKAIPQVFTRIDKLLKEQAVPNAGGGGGGDLFRGGEAFISRLDDAKGRTRTEDFADSDGGEGK